MGRAGKAFFIALAVFVLAPVSAFFIYDAVAFQPNNATIQGILIRADPEDRHPPPIIRRLIRASHQKGSSPATHVARRLLSNLDLGRHGGMLRWHARSLLWECLVRFHFSEDEIMALYAALSYNGQDQGLNALSLRLFSKPLSSLSDKQAATVVAALFAPAIYLRDRHRLKHRSDVLLSRVHGRP